VLLEDMSEVPERDLAGLLRDELNRVDPAVSVVRVTTRSSGGSPGIQVPAIVLVQEHAWQGAPGRALAVGATRGALGDQPAPCRAAFTQEELRRMP